MESTQMRDFSEFCEQLHEIRKKFHKWDSCEKTVALYYLMAGLPFANARFLQHALEQCITVANTPEAQVLERNANNSAFVARLINDHPQKALAALLTHLPLLRPGNKEATNSYLTTIRRVLSEFIAPPYKIYNECVEIMSYVFVHPAFDKEDKKTFKHLLKQVLNRVSPENFIHSPVNESSDESTSPNPERIRFNRRSNSLTPAQTSCESLSCKDVWSSQENLSQPPPKPRSYSLSNDKSLLLNLSSLQSSSSETRLQDLQILANLPAMKSILSWLKSLRLHKYNWVFHNLTYKQMLDLDEQTLQVIGITKGARHKLLLSLQRLRERGSLLTELETEVMNGGDLNCALKKLKGVLQTPLQVTHGEDLPTQFVKVMGKVCTQLLMLRQPSEECLVLFTTLCEKAETAEPFTDEHKRRLNMWKEQLAKGNHVSIYAQKVQSTNRSPWQIKAPAQGFVADTHKSSSYPNMQNSAVVKPHRHSVGSVTLRQDFYPVVKNSADLFKTDLSNTLKSNNVTNQFHVRFEDSDLKEAINRQRILKNTDIENSLESLCLQMMEHALGP